MNESPSASGDDGGDRSVLYLVVTGLVTLFVAMAIVAVTTLTGAESATSAEQSQAQKLSKLPVYWKVKSGDSYQSIAKKTGLTVAQLEEFNPYVNPGTINPGQRLKLRLRIPESRGPRIHIVRRGESFTSIAGKRGRTIARLKELNPKLVPGALRPGQRMRLRK